MVTRKGCLDEKKRRVDRDYVLVSWAQSPDLTPTTTKKIVSRGFRVQRVHSAPGILERSSELLYELVWGKCGVKVWSTARHNRRLRRQ